MKNWKLVAFGVLITLSFVGCSKEEIDEGDPPLPSPYTKVYFKFTQNIDGVTLNIGDSAIYENLIGNIYSVSNLQYLISDIRLNDWNYNNYQIGEYHLVDVKDATTLTFAPKDSIIARDYASISLFVGFREKENKTGSYPDLNDLGWGWKPGYGGGYYTLKMDGQYLKNGSDPTQSPYNLAIGGNKLVETSTDTSYKPNEIVASLSNSDFPLPRGINIITIEIKLNVNKLFASPTGVANYNIDEHESNIEEDAIASAILSDNISAAFSIGDVTYNKAPE